MQAFEQFKNLVQQQLEYGAKKYAHSNEREVTDILVQYHSFRWLIGTLDKYVGRFKNLMRERDPLKIATYCYIIWLKRGFHVHNEGTKEIIDTNIETKSKNFDKFYNNVEEIYKNEKFYYDNYKPENALDRISDVLKVISKNEWTDLTDNTIFVIYSLCFSIWKNEFYNQGLAGIDTDTYNEERNNGSQD